MKTLNGIFLGITLCVSCTSNDTKMLSNGDSNTIGQSKSPFLSDTTIEYKIEGLSSEGTSVIAKYTRGKLKECNISVYGETGQNRISYNFNGDKIDVLEKQLIYNSPLEKTKSEKNMKVKKEIKYVLDLNGNLIGKADEERTDIFMEFKKVVPFEMK